MDARPALHAASGRRDAAEELKVIAHRVVAFRRSAGPLPRARPKAPVKIILGA